MNFYKQDDLEEATRLAITNTENNAARRQQLAAFGFGPARFNTGKALLKAFTDKQAEQARCQNEQWSLSKQLNESLLAVTEQFREHVLVVQAAFRHDAELLHSLKIERFATRRWEGVRQATHFYWQLREQKGIAGQLRGKRQRIAASLRQRYPTATAQAKCGPTKRALLSSAPKTKCSCKRSFGSG